METHDILLAWSVLEAVLLMPAFAALYTLLLGRWTIPLQTLSPEASLTAFVSPATGAMVGAVIGFGFSKIVGGDIAGAAYVGAGLLFAAYGGSGIAQLLDEAEQPGTLPFRAGEWRRDLDYLRRLYRVSREDRQAFEQQASQLARCGEQACEQARSYRFGIYWRDRRRRVRAGAYLWIAAGVAVAVRVSFLMHSPPYLASSITGAVSVVLSAWALWHLKRRSMETSGHAQVRAAGRIRQELQRLQGSPVPTTLRKRLAMLISPESAAPG
jgi:hypothetical protein